MLPVIIKKSASKGTICPELTSIYIILPVEIKSAFGYEAIQASEKSGSLIA